VTADRAIIAVKRFGLGARPGDLAALRSDPRGYVLAQLDNPGALVIGGDLLPSREIIVDLYRYNIRQRRLAERRPSHENRGMASDENADRPALETKAPRYDLPEVEARMRIAVHTPAPLLERLTHFWANHFCVSIEKSLMLRSLAGAYEREVIRPRVLGRFGDMLKAAIRHPAMLHYLDNAQSVGPTSPAGKRNKAGLNENLAREVLELHTVGVGGGYDQEDVRNFAKALTGWRFAPSKGEFFFQRAAHERGSVTVMGRRYEQENEGKALAILDDLVAHPKTAEHVARKLARHFVRAAPPEALVARLASTFRDSGGDLRAVTETLVASDESWSVDRPKIVPPFDLLVAAFRAVQVVPRTQFIVTTLATFGQPLWGVGSPAGWPDEDMAWAAPDAMLERADWAERAAAMVGGSAVRDVPALAEDVLGEALSGMTLEAIRRAESRRQALALLFVSPEFQRR